MAPGADTVERCRLAVLGGAIDVDLGRLTVDAGGLRRQVREYEAGRRRTFDVDVTFPDSFAGRVMREMTAIPYGRTRTYGELAAALDSAPRAVGGACGRNPVPLVVPCHRVIRADGGLGGFSSPGGVALKRRLLAHEATVAGRSRS